MPTGFPSRNRTPIKVFRRAIRSLASVVLRRWSVPPFGGLDIASVERLSETETADAASGDGRDLPCEGRTARQGPSGAESRPEATESLRGLVDAIILTPDRGGETFRIELRGNVATMLAPRPAFARHRR